MHHFAEIVNFFVPVLDLSSGLKSRKIGNEKKVDKNGIVINMQSKSNWRIPQMHAQRIQENSIVLSHFPQICFSY